MNSMLIAWIDLDIVIEARCRFCRLLLQKGVFYARALIKI